MKVERFKAIYDEILEYSIKLAADPASLGPKYLNDQIATCRNYINSVTLVLLELHREKHTLMRAMSGEEDILAIESNELLTNDDRVRRLPSIDDRKAAINVLLRDRVAAIAALKRQIQDLDYVEKAVKHRHRELKDTMAEIKLQRALLRDELDTNAFYGDERVKDGALVTDEDDALSPDEVEQFFQAEQSPPEAPVAPPEAPEAPAEKPDPALEHSEITDADEQAIEDFMAEDESAEENDDLDDLLQGL